MKSDIDSPIPIPKIAVAGAVLGLFYVFWLLPLTHIVGTSNLWLIGDCGSHVSALRAYLADGWHDSILRTTHLNYPQGINVAFADIIPLAAVPIKIISPYLPAGFHYFGYWLVFSYTMQGAAASVLLYMSGVRRWLWILAATAVFLLSPAMLFRIHAHTALTSHGYLLIALVLYFQMVRQNNGFWLTVCGYAILNCASLLTHPYLLTMVFPIYIAALLDHVRHNHHFLRAVMAALAVIVVIIALLWFGGYLDSGVEGLSGGGGFGLFSMNMVAPFVGGEILDLSAWRDHLGTNYGTCPIPYDATGGQYEGYNYLGLGVLLSFFIVVIFQGRWLLRKICRYPALTLLMIGFTLYAVSNKGFFADNSLWAIQLPEFFSLITEQFRASGRFFWPVGYIITLTALVGLSRFCSSRLVTCALFTVLLLQIIDTTPLREMTYEKIALPKPTLLTDAWWIKQIKKSDALYLFPAFGCGAKPYTDVAPVQHLAVSNGVPFNTGLFARGYVNCAAKEAALTGGLKPGSMYIFLKDHYNKDDIKHRFGEEIFKRCRSFEFGYVFKP